MSNSIRDQVLALKSAELAREFLDQSVPSVTEAAAAYVRELEETGALTRAWMDYTRKYPILGGL